MNYQLFIDTISKLNPSSTFLALKEYRNEYGDISDYSIVFNINYKNALKRSIKKLNEIIVDDDLSIIAKRELLNSFNLRLNSENNNTYSRVVNSNGDYVNGIKIHNKTKTLYLYGLLVHKRNILPGKYPKRNHRPLTIAKNKLYDMCPVSKFRQFIFSEDRVNYISLHGMHLFPASL